MLARLLADVDFRLALQLLTHLVKGIYGLRPSFFSLHW